MDANRLRFWMLAENHQWMRPGNPPAVEYEPRRRSLGLARERTLTNRIPTNRWGIRVNLPDSQQSQAFYFTVQPSESQPLSISAIAPFTPIVSQTSQPLTVNGQGFQPDIVVTVMFPDGGTTILTSQEIESFSDTQLTLNLILDRPGPWSIEVNRADSSQSDLFHFTVQLADLQSLQITAIAPNTPTTSTSPQTLQVTGRGFQPDLTVTVLYPNGSSTVLETSQLNNLTETSFELSFIFSSREVALGLLNQIPQTRDNLNTRAYWDSESRRVMATGARPDAIGIFIPPLEQEPSDLAMGYDGVLYMAIADQIIMQDCRGRWLPTTLPSLEGFSAWRLAADSQGGVWVLERGESENQDNWQIARVQGIPFPNRPYSRYTPDTFRPCQENPYPPKLTIVWCGHFDEGEEPVAIACSPSGRLALLSWIEGQDARVRCLNSDGTWTAAITLKNAHYPYSLTWVSDERIAILISSLTTEALVYEIPLNLDLTTRRITVQPVGDFYPLRNYQGEPFLHGINLPPHYPTSNGSAPLYPLSLPTFARRGEAIGQTPFDSDSAQTVWHRLYLEAAIPPNCGISVYLAADNDDSTPPPWPGDDWYEHRFGESFAPSDLDIPRGAWVSSPSEIPFHPGLLSCKPQKNRSGLFTVLIQRANRQVRSLQGRYLWVRVELTGDGRSTPEIAALRVYAPRFSYLNSYLPALYRETLFGPEADKAGGSTPADFLERFLDNFEGLLTPLEDRIAQSYLLSDPRTTPESALEWLGSWIGVAFDSAYSSQQKRELLQATPELYRRRGTLKGLEMALEVATGGKIRHGQMSGGAVSGGEIIVLENFRLRRTFATILGADLADEQDPLLQGLAISGNSYVGDTLILGEESQQEFLALFGSDLPTQEEEEAILAFFDELAYRVTVFVHQEVEPQDLGLLRRVVELETPAHILSTVVTASQPLIVGLASLVGVDTYLTTQPQPQPVKVEESRVGTGDRLQRLASLDPRLEGGTLSARLDKRRPVANAGQDLEVEYGQSFWLDGSESEAFAGETIERYIWRRISN